MGWRVESGCGPNTLADKIPRPIRVRRIFLTVCISSVYNNDEVGDGVGAGVRGERRGEWGWGWKRFKRHFSTFF